jgi:tetraacyldisaccharide 4'-kinase
MEFLRLLLLPLAIIYGLIVSLRNKLFDFKILPSSSYPFTVISVGNLSAGGTGKTPHVEYIIRLLSHKASIATLSRGYGRKTHGFRLADQSDHAGTIGDEPAQFHKKFPEIIVAADEKRSRGISKILELKPETDVIILDDAFQHRYVKPGLSILLTDYHKQFTEDYLLPYGTLRESIKGAGRANVIVVTKTPNILSPYERRHMIETINPKPYQKVLFSYVKYGELKPLWDNLPLPESGKHFSVILLVAGIANPYPLEYELRNWCSDLIIIRFKDHHKYTSDDFVQIKENYADIYTRNKLLITTEKDAMRMLDPDIREAASELPIYYIPMEIDFHSDDKQIFDETILNYVRENKRER